MLTALDIARYFLFKDVSGQIFNGNGDGDKRLGLYLYLAQIVYIANNGVPLMDAEFYAYDNGVVVPEVQGNYATLCSQPKSDVEMPTDIKDFLDRFYKAFESADLDELIEILREDEAWAAKYGKVDQGMDLMEYADLYRAQYRDIVKVLYRMEGGEIEVGE